MSDNQQFPFEPGGPDPVDPSQVKVTPVPVRPRRWPRILLVGGIALAVLAGGIGIAAYTTYKHLDANISQQDITHDLGPSKNRPQQPVASAGETYTPLNILLLGSDTRAGQDAKYGRLIGGARSDTVILLHIYGDRKRAIAVSFPRDTWVDIPSCRQADGTMSTPHKNRFNEAFSLGGPACTVKTIEAMSGVFINHFAVVDFAGFKNMVSALGGVSVCLPKAVNDPLSGLILPAGNSVVTGEQALAFVRARYTLGDGSDLSRITRQQTFMSSMIQQLQSAGTLLNPVRLYQVLDAATKSLTVDPGLGSLSNLKDLASQLRDIKTSNIQFKTLPWTPRPDGATVQMDVAKATPLFEAMKSDAAYPPTATKPSDGGAALTVPASEISVQVLNGSGISGLATAVANELTAAGFKVVGVGNADRSNYPSTTIRYGANRSQSSRTVSTSLGGAKTVEVTTLGDTITIVVGRANVAAKPIVVYSPATSTASSTTGVKTADQNICSG